MIYNPLFTNVSVSACHYTFKDIGLSHSANGYVVKVGGHQPIFSPQIIPQQAG